MDLLLNPFYILSASPRDNKRRIMELADERSLLFDSSACMEARSNLTNPRKRLSAEVAWLPGIGPKRANELVSLVESSPMALLQVCSTENFSFRFSAETTAAHPSKAIKLSPIVRANLLAAGLLRLTGQNVDDVAEWILELSLAFEDVESNELSVVINEERIVSGFQEVSDLSAVESEIQERRRHFRQVIKSALDNLSPKELVEAVTVAVEAATDDGEEHGPILIADLIDAYEVEAQGFLDKEEGNIKAIVEKLRTDVDAELPDSTLAPMVNQLILVVKNWDTVAQPIQVSAKSRGLDHDASLRVAGLVRGLAIHMFNEHCKLDFSQQLTNMLQEVFAEVGEVAERTAEDADALGEIAEQRVRLIEDVKNRAEEWRREITYEADVGVLKKKFRISPEGIELDGEHWDFDSISRIRWGGTRYSERGNHTTTLYEILFGGSNCGHILLNENNIYLSIIERLWRAVGVRLLTDFLKGLRDGKRYWYRSAIIVDHGVEIERKKFFGRNERVFCRWDELMIWNGAGIFCIGKKEDKKLFAALSYQNEDNIHVIEAAIRMFWKRGGDRLSSLLEE